MQDSNPLCEICDYPVMVGAPISLCRLHIIEAHEFAIKCIEITAPANRLQRARFPCPECGVMSLVRDILKGDIYCERRFGGCGKCTPHDQEPDWTWVAEQREAEANVRAEERRGQYEAAKVYYIVLGDRVKIGASMNPALRATSLSLRPEDVAATEDGGYPREGERHRQFAHLRISGEWFRAEPDLLAHLASLTP